MNKSGTATEGPPQTFPDNHRLEPSETAEKMTEAVTALLSLRTTAQPATNLPYTLANLSRNPSFALQSVGTKPKLPVDGLPGFKDLSDHVKIFVRHWWKGDKFLISHMEHAPLLLTPKAFEQQALNYVEQIKPILPTILQPLKRKRIEETKEPLPEAFNHLDESVKTILYRWWGGFMFRILLEDRLRIERDGTDAEQIALQSVDNYRSLLQRNARVKI